MCTVSMITDHYIDKWQQYPPYKPSDPMPDITIDFTPQITKEEIEEFRKLLERARKYDQENNQPDCELAEKKERIKELITEICNELDIEIDFL